MVEQGKVVTAAGVSAGIDMALMLADRIAGPEVAQAIQLGIEYDPQPPFDAGSPEKAPAAIVDIVRQVERAEEAAAGRGPRARRGEDEEEGGGEKEKRPQEKNKSAPNPRCGGAPAPGV